MATLADAVALTVIVPETVAPELGEVIATLTVVLSALPLGLVSPAQPEFVRASNKMTGSQPPQPIPHVHRVSLLPKFIVGFPSISLVSARR
jgi:hypothetical protein